MIRIIAPNEMLCPDAISIERQEAAPDIVTPTYHQESIF